MSVDNINFTRKHMVVNGEYFYYFDERNDTLYKKVSDGGTVFTYPIEESLGSNQVIAVEYDGHYFWTLQKGITNEDVVIKKWYIDNFVCKLDDTISLTHDVDNKFDSPTFIVEYYNTSLIAPILKYDSEVSLTDYGSMVESGTILTIGPNSSGQYVDVTVTGTLPGENRFGLDFYIYNDYEEDTNVYFSKSIWLINHFLYTESGGGLYKIKLPRKEIDKIIEYPELESVISSCFYDTIETQYLLFNVGTTLRFFNIKTLVVEKSMVIDNIKSDQSTIIPIYDLKVKDNILYRLQDIMSYFGVDYLLSTYNYQSSPLRPFVDSVTLDVSPKILPSNGINVAELTSVVRDQYDDPIKLKPVTFEDSDPTGYITTINTYTNKYGIAHSVYRAGIVPNEVVINVIATQYD